MATFSAASAREPTAPHPVGSAAGPSSTAAAAERALADLAPGSPFILRVSTSAGDGGTLALSGTVPPEGHWVTHRIPVHRSLEPVLPSMRFVFESPDGSLELPNPFRPDAGLLRDSLPPGSLFTESGLQTPLGWGSGMTFTLVLDGYINRGQFPGWIFSDFISSIQPTMASPGQDFVVGGSFPGNPATTVCVMLPGGQVGAPMVGGSTQLNAEIVPGNPATVSGPVCIMTGTAAIVDGSQAPPFPFIQNPNWRLWTGTATGAITSPSPVTVQGVPGGIEFFLVGSETTGQVWAHQFDDCPAGSEISMFIRLKQNGTFHDFFMLDPANNTKTKKVEVPVDLSANQCALYFCGLLSAAMSPGIPGLACDVIGDTILLSVRVGTGIEEFDGWVNVQ